VDIRFLRIVGTYLQNYTASHPSKQYSYWGCVENYIHNTADKGTNIVGATYCIIINVFDGWRISVLISLRGQEICNFRKANGIMFEA
jgi:hypothetical protein